MDSFKLSVKLFLAAGSHFEQEVIVPVLHSWIQNHAVEGHLLIDVADYRHVDNGPGIVLVAHEGNYSTDSSAGDAPGLLYVRKQPIDGDFAARLKQTFKYALQAAAKLEQAPELAGKVKFRTDNPLVRVYDRLLAPNDAPTFDAVRPDLAAVLSQLYGGEVKLEHQANEETVFEVKVTADLSPDVAMLLTKL